MYSKITRKINITVNPYFLDDQSEPEDQHFVWAYQVTIDNQSSDKVQLKNRYWKIIDSNGSEQEVRGEGVVEDFPGNYSDFRAYDDSKLVITETLEDDKKEKKNWKKDSNVKLSYNEQKEYKNLESKIKSLEFDKLEMEKKFLNPDLSPDEINKLSSTLQVIINSIEEKEMRWLELTEKMEG